MADDPRLKEFLKEQEGIEPVVYSDQNKIPTVGIGANLRSPEVPQILENVGLNPQEVKAGQQALTPEQMDAIYRQQMAEKERYFKKIKQRDFPQAEIADNEKRALMSLMFNSPQLIGPKMREYLQNNMDEDVAREIMLRSNQKKSPGIQKRRLDEAKEYLGGEDRFQQLFNSLSDEEKIEIRDILQNIQNEHERIKVFNEYPFLNEIAPRNRFPRLKK